MSLQFLRLQPRLAQIRSAINEFLWPADTTKLSLWQRTLIRSSQIFIAVVRDLIEGQLSLRAMSLVFTTVIGFFPLLALTFAVLKGLGAHNALEPTLLALLQPLGERSNEFTSEILSYVDAIQVELIGITSVGLLLYIVMDMMRKIESSFNYIWAVKQGRSWSSRVSEYLFAVIVSPLLLFLSISISSSVNTSLFERFLEGLAYGSLVIEFIAFVTPMLFMSLAFAFAYGFLPNTKVQFSSAFIGGLVTTIIWKLMGSVFQGFFISSARESIYLAFATAVAVMFFAYIGWLVALVGSSIAFYHQNPAKARSGREMRKLSIIQQEELGMTIASIIINRFNQGLEPVNEDELLTTLSANPVVIEYALHTLEEIGLISKTDDEPARFLPTKSVNDCTLAEIWKALRRYDADPLEETGYSKDLGRVREFQSQLEQIVESELGNKKFID
ncbi:MAG: YihY/virulence factor BrkB family protein [Pseudohongiella sp.]|nr:YihY/virulence factor BrkB family protein [Pseudohongiella sp.]